LKAPKTSGGGRTPVRHTIPLGIVIFIVLKETWYPEIFDIFATNGVREYLTIFAELSNILSFFLFTLNEPMYISSSKSEMI